MTLNTNDHSLLDKALRGNLTPDDQLQFEERMRDPVFRKEHAYMIDMEAAAKKRGRELLRADLENIESGVTGLVGNGKRRSMLQWLSVAAAIVVLVVAGYIVKSRQTDTRFLYMAYFKAPPNTVAPILKSDALQCDSYAQAFRKYEAGSYEEAEVLFKQMDNSDPNVLFYRGITAMELDELDRAVTLLQTLEDRMDTTYCKQAQWYHALALLSRNKDACIKLLTEIANTPAHPYQAEAKELLRKL